MSLEALDRNGHNLSLPYDSLAPPFGIPVLKPVQLNQHLQWIPFNAAMTDKRRAEHGVHFFIDDYLLNARGMIRTGMQHCSPAFRRS